MHITMMSYVFCLLASRQ